MFKVIESEEDVRAFYLAGLLWWKGDGSGDVYKQETYIPADFDVNAYAQMWAERATWNAYVYVEE